MKYDVFISYRRQGGYETALPIVEKLRSAGYRVFFDLESLNAGKFNEQLYSVIDSATDFILVLPEGGLDRCSAPDDWVRREVERALASGKNIIPVMLKGFTWPAELPESLRSLPDYQGISATSPEHFDMAVTRLKGYMKSKPRRPLRRWLTTAAIAIGVLLALTCAAYFTFRQLAKPVCTKVGTQLTYLTNLVHSMHESDNEFERAWQSYVTQRQNSSEAAKVRLDEAFLSDIDNIYAARVEALTKQLPPFNALSSYENFLIGLYDVDPADVESLPFILNAEAEGLIEKYAVRKAIIDNRMFNTATLATIEEGRACEQLGCNIMYYNYMETMKHLPEEALRSHAQLAQKWHLYPTVSEQMSAAEFADLRDKEMNKLEKALAPMQALTDMLLNHVNQKEEYLSDMEKVIEENNLATDNELAERRERVERKRAEVEELKAQLSEKEQALIDQFNSFKSKFAIADGDDQYYKWGKICRSASFLALTVASNKQRQAENISPVISNAEVLDFVNAQLDTYAAAHPDAKACAAAAKAFYADVANGRRQLSGMIMMGTQNDAPHPLLAVGDIIIKRNGHIALDDMEAYKASVASTKEGTVTFLRLDPDGTLREHSADFPKTDVAFGLLPLKD